MILVGKLSAKRAFQPVTARIKEDYLHDPQGVLNKEKALSASFVGFLRRLSGFFISSLRIQTAFDAQLEIKNPAANATGIFLCSGG